MWKKILLKVLAGEEKIPSPFHPEGIMNYLFVSVDKKEKDMGFLWIWCSKTLRGINLSRLEIPRNVQTVTVDEFSKMKLPEIEFLNPSTAEGVLAP